MKRLFSSLILIAIFFEGNAQWIKFDAVSKGNAIAHDETLYWLIGTDDQIYYSRDDGPYDGVTSSTSKWIKHSSTRKCIDIDGYQGSAYVIGANFNIYKISDDQETQLGVGQGRRIAVDPRTGIPWIVGRDAKIYTFNGQKWVRYHETAEAIDIDAFGGFPTFIGKDNKVYRGNSSGYEKIEAGAALRISVYGQLLYISGTDNKFYRYLNNQWIEFPGGERGFDICAGGKNPFMIGPGKMIYYQK